MKNFLKLEAKRSIIAMLRLAGIVVLIAAVGIMVVGCGNNLSGTFSNGTQSITFNRNGMFNARWGRGTFIVSGNSGTLVRDGREVGWFTVLDRNTIRFNGDFAGGNLFIRE